MECELSAQKQNVHRKTWNDFAFSQWKKVSSKNKSRLRTVSGDSKHDNFEPPLEISGSVTNNGKRERYRL